MKVIVAIFFSRCRLGDGSHAAASWRAASGAVTSDRSVPPAQSRILHGLDGCTWRAVCPRESQIAVGREVCGSNGQFAKPVTSGEAVIETTTTVAGLIERAADGVLRSSRRLSGFWQVASISLQKPLPHRARRLEGRCAGVACATRSHPVGVKKTGKGRRKIGRKKRRMRSRIRHRKG
ncbi:MAG: hypothetical protein HYS13_18270 [Planctomycetia bacterium]|nr:hypothetical protein [Planctomycetia bacterium]